MNDRKEYEDIIGLPHHESVRHPRMATADRAAQFAPFAALTGFGDTIDDTAKEYEAAIAQIMGKQEFVF